MDKVAALKKEELAEADRLAQTAIDSSKSALSSTTLAAAQVVIAAVQKNDGAGIVNEPVNDLRRIRTAPALMSALDRDLRIARKQAEMLIIDALTLGYRTEAQGQADVIGVDMRVTITADDRAAFADYPVVGHTPYEAAEALTAKLKYDVEGALALPLTGIIDAKAIPASLGAISMAHGNRVGFAVKEAYFVGVKAGFLAVGEALTGAK